MRLALALVADHPYDMAMWAYYQRLFYESGTLDFRYFPTLPVIYFLQLGSYSVYAVFGRLGVHDILLFYHTTYMVEGLFLKLPMILADLGAFLLLARYWNNEYAALYYLNPFTIYLSAAWGTYDSVMILFLGVGFLALKQERKRLATASFAVSGLVKLFGLVPLALLLLETLVRRRWKDLLVDIAVTCSLGTVVFSPILLQGGVQDFLSGFLLRFVGLNGAQTRTYNIFAAIQGTAFGGSPPYIWLALASIAIVFLVRTRTAGSSFLPVLQTSMMGAVLLNVFSQAEPQWLSWPVFLAMIYASTTSREGLAYYTYVFGIVATFLTMTLTQGFGYILFGLPQSFFLGPLEGFSGYLSVYVVTIMLLLLLLAAYFVAKPVRFRLEVLALIVIIYVQAYFWLSIVRTQNP